MIQYHVAMMIYDMQYIQNPSYLQMELWLHSINEIWVIYSYAVT